jgi:delta-lactam-biosynthetic de-N-acetylase
LLSDDLVKLIEGIAGSYNVKINEPMKNHTSFRIGGPADILITPASISVLREVVEICKRENIQHFIMGNGTNLVVRDKGIRGVVIKTSEKLKKFSVYDSCIEAEAGILLSELSSIALENDVRAIFFVTGSYIENHPDLVRRMLDEGHQVGSHTINHPSLPDLGYEELENELLGLEEKFYEKFNVGFKYMRPPMGEYSERTLAAAQQLGYKTVFWSFAYDDWYTDRIRGADYAYNKVMENLHNGAVFLLHAVSKDNAEALDRIIKDIKANGYEIRPFDL